MPSQVLNARSTFEKIFPPSAADPFAHHHKLQVTGLLPAQVPWGRSGFSVPSLFQERVTAKGVRGAEDPTGSAHTAISEPVPAPPDFINVPNSVT